MGGENTNQCLKTCFMSQHFMAIGRKKGEANYFNRCQLFTDYLFIIISTVKLLRQFKCIIGYSKQKRVVFIVPFEDFASRCNKAIKNNSWLLCTTSNRKKYF